MKTCRQMDFKTLEFSQTSGPATALMHASVDSAGAGDAAYIVSAKRAGVYVCMFVFICVLVCLKLTLKSNLARCVR